MLVFIATPLVLDSVGGGRILGSLEMHDGMLSLLTYMVDIRREIASSPGAVGLTLCAGSRDEGKIILFLQLSDVSFSCAAALLFADRM